MWPAWSFPHGPFRGAFFLCCEASHVEPAAPSPFSLLPPRGSRVAGGQSAQPAGTADLPSAVPVFPHSLPRAALIETLRQSIEKIERPVLAAAPGSSSRRGLEARGVRGGRRLSSVRPRARNRFRARGEARVAAPPVRPPEIGWRASASPCALPRAASTRWTRGDGNLLSCGAGRAPSRVNSAIPRGTVSWRWASILRG